MTDPSNRTFVCSVLFLDIVEYSKKSVTEQLKLKQRFNAFLVTALQHVAVSERIVLDTGDGAAVSFLGNPEDPLFIGIALRDAIAAENPNETPPLLVRIGINLGPVRLIKDINGQLNIIGDGINVAQRVMSFGEPGAILVSRSYYEVVSRLSDDYENIFQDAGTRTDKHVREHSVYAVGALPRNAAQLQASSATSPDHQSADSLPASEGFGMTSPLPEKRAPISPRVLIGAPLMAIAIIAAGVLLRHQLGKDSEVASVTAKASPVTSTAPVPSVAALMKPAEVIVAASRQDIPAVAEMPKPDLSKSKITLAIIPWGEIFVDGRARGISPPLKSLTLAPGKHLIEVKNTTFPPYKETISLKSDATLKIQHKF